MVLLAAVLAMPAAAPQALDAATRVMRDGFATSIVDKLCTVQGQLDQAAANVRRDRPDLSDEQIDAFKSNLVASAPELRAACGQRVRDALGGEDGPLARYGERLRAELERSPVPREFEQLHAFLESPAGRHVEAARRSVDAEAYVVHVAQLVVMAAATSSVTRSLVGPDASARYDRELFRMAKASLFNPEPPKRSGRRPARRTEKR